MVPARGITPCDQVGDGTLNIGYTEVGAERGRAVILFHDSSASLHDYVGVAPLLADAGYRVIVLPKGRHTTHPRDVIALMDKLRIETAIVGGFDGGADTAVVMANMWPERCRAMVAVNGYLITNVDANGLRLLPRSEFGGSTRLPPGPGAR